MLKLETQSGFKGFSVQRLPGECHYTYNMMPTPFGLAPFYKNTALGSTTGLVRHFVEYDASAASGGNLGTMWALDDANKVYSSSDWGVRRSIAVAGSGNGMIVDQKSRLLIVNNQYLTSYTAATNTWNESFKDLGSSVTGDKVMDTYLDWVVIPHGNKICLLNTTDDSLNTAGLTFPTGCSAIIAKSSRTGILIGVNMGYRSFVALWDAQSDRAISEWIWNDSQLVSICRASDTEWIVTTKREIYSTNGYVKKALPQIDNLLNTTLYGPITAGTAVLNNKFYLAHSPNAIENIGRRKNGVFVLDMETQLWNFVSTASNSVTNVTLGALYINSTGQIYSAHRNHALSSYSISTISNESPSSAYLISAPFGATGTLKIAEGIKVDVVANNHTESYQPMSFTIKAKLYDNTRPLWAYGYTLDGSDLDEMPVGGTQIGFNNAQVGDEVTFLSGSNAGAVRHITAIANKNGATETWTLDSPLAHLPVAGDFFNVSPLKLVNSFTVSSADSIPVQGLYFDVKNRIRAKQFLVKILFEGISTANIAVSSISFLYDDQGIV